MGAKLNKYINEEEHKARNKTIRVEMMSRGAKCSECSNAAVQAGAGL